MSERPPGELSFRSSTVSDVSFPERIIQLVVIPYEEEALVEIKGRMVRESIARGAFDGIERRANRIRVNRDHKLERTVGRAVAFHPSREEGLVADLKIAKTELGDETLTLAADDCLDASAGYLPMPDGEKWLTRTAVQDARAVGSATSPSPPTRPTSRAKVLSVRQDSEWCAYRGSPVRSSQPRTWTWSGRG